MDIQKLAEDWVNDGTSGYPEDEAGRWMFNKLVEAYKAGYTEALKQNSHKHGVMQGLASRMQDCPPEIVEIVNKNWDKLLDASPSVGNSADGQSGRDGVMKWCDSCGKITKWIDGDCENYKTRGGSAKGALPR